MSFIKPKLPVIINHGKTKTKIKSSLEKNTDTNP